MANAGDQKMKMLYIMEMFLRESDEEHPINAAMIADRLRAKGLVGERKSIYRDVYTLVDFGMDIVRSTEKKDGFYLASRDFELPELKLLADAVAASKFIPEKKAASLVKKIGQLGSVHEARQLQRQVVVSDRARTENESIFYAIDVIYNCIDNNHQMEFLYSEWTADKKKQLRRGGEVYVVSPEFLLWDNEYYYLVAYEQRAGAIRHYRVDKIVNAQESNHPRDGIEERKKLRKADYARKRFGMFAGETETVSLRCKKNMVGVMLDRFGTQANLRADGEEHILVRCEIEVSPQFFGWLAGMGVDVTIAGPAQVKADYRSYLEKILGAYDG